MNQDKEPKFLVDFMLGRLAKWLRIFGYDTEYALKTGNRNLPLDSLKEDRVILTRNRSLSNKRSYKLILIRSDYLFEQAKQLMSELDITVQSSRLFTRCTTCNLPIKSVEKEAIKNKIPEYIYDTINDFSYCSKCKKVFWHGTHTKLLYKDLKKAGIEVKC
ncbi:MAG: Mut7-C RNAse domain-containing protein [Elusimicrobia bacterium]|nr:Mut7-C RNAse domain-containing protein [Candidatus Liberimonas magnetica]